MFVKVCGIQKPVEIDWAVELGYSAIGVVLHKKSVRYCDPEKARALAAHARGRILSVAVAVKYEEVKKAADSFDYIQVYEPVILKNLIYAGAEPPAGIDYEYFLFDKSRGSGETIEIPRWIKRTREKLIIAGGLTPGNVGKIIKKFNPFGLDVSSGVETERGVKDYNRMKQFIDEVKNGVH